MTKVKC